MGLVEFYDPVAKQQIEYNISDQLEPKWATMSKKVIKENDDRVYVVVGQEGSGKSTFAFQQAKYIDPTFDLDRICFSPEQFLEQIQTAKPGQVVVFDEAFRGFSSKASQSKVNKMLVQAMMEVRRRNLIIFIVIPSLILLENYIVVHRSNAIFFVYKRNVKGNKYRGWKAYSRSKAAQLYHKAKKNYGILPRVFTARHGKFWARRFEIDGVMTYLPYETFDEKAYDLKKGVAFGDKKSEDAMDNDKNRVKWLQSMISREPKSIKSKKDRAKYYGVGYRQFHRWGEVEIPINDDSDA